jgi:glycosyltransferase involved in cell wall biosynthesis
VTIVPEMADTRVAYVYPNSRRELIAGCKAGTAPDTHLLGLNQIGQFGIDAEVREPALDTHASFLPHRLRWHLRELTLPWELRDVDVIFTPLANLVPLASRLRRRPPVLVYNFGFNTILRRAGRARRALLASALRQTAGVVCLGPSQRDELIELTDLDPERVPVAIHGVDERFFAPGREQRERVVLAVGKDLARDYRTLAQAARSIDARFVFVVLQRNVEGIVLPPNVEIRERISYIELRDLYQRAACAVVALRRPDYPFGSEGSGVTALLEAGASATPLVATDRPIIRDYLRDEETALIVEEENADALRARIEWMIDDSAYAQSLARAGRHRVEERHTMNDMAAALAPLMKGAARRE